MAGALERFLNPSKASPLEKHQQAMLEQVEMQRLAINAKAMRDEWRITTTAHLTMTAMVELDNLGAVSLEGSFGNIARINAAAQRLGFTPNTMARTMEQNELAKGRLMQQFANNASWIIGGV